MYVKVSDVLTAFALLSVECYIRPTRVNLLISFTVTLLAVRPKHTLLAVPGFIVKLYPLTMISAKNYY